MVEADFEDQLSKEHLLAEKKEKYWKTKLATRNTAHKTQTKKKVEEKRRY